tara:strand:+ start:43 stop:408 length:366 start_codon:yes stop_codon:yes gene_type:complete
MDQVILDFIPTYKLITDNINDSNTLYQLQFLQFFNIHHYDDSIINTKINNIYLEIKDNEQIIKLIQIIKNKNPNVSIDDLIAFKLLFCYDYFNIFIKCLYQLKFNKKISDKELYNLIYFIK